MIAKISPVPSLIITRKGDKLIPAENGRKLFASEGEPKELWIIAGADPCNTFVSVGACSGKSGEFLDKNAK